MKFARDYHMDVYPEGVTKEMVDSWVDASKLSGGKSVAVNERPDEKEIMNNDRKELIYQHAGHINKLNRELGEGKHHITAPDMGTKVPDMTALSFFTTDVASMSAEFGGSENPSPVTALGVFYGTKAMLKFIGKDGNNTTFAIQGAAGEVGSHLVQHLKEEYPDAKIVITEDEKKSDAQIKAQKMANIYTNTSVVHGDEIFQQEDSIFVPSGPSAQLNDAHLDMMQKARVAGVIGPANYLYPPYKEQEMSQKFHEAGILVAPAPLVNQGGIFKIALGELLPGEKPNEEAINKSIAHVGPLLKEVFEQAQNQNKTPEEIFREIALDEFAALCQEYGLIK